MQTLNKNTERRLQYFRDYYKKNKERKLKMNKDRYWGEKHEELKAAAAESGRRLYIFSKKKWINNADE
jgi:hypothetical protein